MTPDDPMDELFRQADADGLWFYTSYQGLWFSPDELRTAHKDGRFRWGAVNWTLRNPDELIEEKRKAVVAATRAFEEVCARVGAARRAGREQGQGR